MLTVTKKFSFCYGHHLPEHKGKCKYLHGHNSEVEVEVRLNDGRNEDAINEEGMVLDFGELKKYVDPILDELDHHHLNDVLPKAFLPPTAENIVRFIAGKLKDTFPIARIIVMRVRVSETPTSWAEWKA